MKDIAAYIEKALKNRIDNALIIGPSRVITAPWVRMKCQFGCAGYGQTLCCPPHSPTPEETRKILDSYTKAMLLHKHWKKGYETVDTFNAMVVDAERNLFLDGYYKAWAMGSGPCRLCKTCNVNGFCLNSDRARPAMEACGIDVFATARGLGLPIHVVREHAEERDIYGLILIE